VILDLMELVRRQPLEVDSARIHEALSGRRILRELVPEYSPFVDIPISCEP
jgi:hypothetical protein